MKKIMVILSLVLAVSVGFSGSAIAQTPSLELDPSSVDEAGSHELEVSLSGFSSEIALFVLPCDAPEGGDLAALNTATCDQANLTPIKMDADGAGTVSVTYDVPEEGIVVIAGDAARTQSAMALLTVGAAELPDTGTNSFTFSVIGLTLVAGGAMVVANSRRLG